jgi:hypothetical protein
MEATTTHDRRLGAAVRAGGAWYDDVFRVHGIPTRREGGLWRALAEPPRWHSVAKTLHPDVPTAQVVDAMAPFDRCSVADSFATLDLGDESAEVHPMLGCAEVLYPGVAVVGYWRNDTLAPYTGAGFQAVGPHVVWLKAG